MATKPPAETPVSPELFTEMQTKTVEAFSAFSQANQRVMQQLVELSTEAAREGMRASFELQTATVDAVRAAQAATAPREPAESATQDPFAAYQKGLAGAVDGTQKALRLMETQAQILTRSAERFQVSAERTGREIQEALTSYVGRMKEIYGRN